MKKEEYIKKRNGRKICRIFCERNKKDHSR